MLPILNGEKNKIEFEFSHVPEEDGALRQTFADIDFSSPVKVRGFVKSMAGYMFLHEDISLDYKTACARCAEPVDGKLEFAFEKDIADEGVSEDNDDYIFIKDKKLDLIEPTEEQLMLELPSKTLCRDDCAGLCIKCGKNLNYGKCSCKEETGDPRLQILKTLLK